MMPSLPNLLLPRRIRREARKHSCLRKGAQFKNSLRRELEPALAHASYYQEKCAAERRIQMLQAEQAKAGVAVSS